MTKPTLKDWRAELKEIVEGIHLDPFHKDLERLTTFIEQILKEQREEVRAELLEEWRKEYEEDQEKLLKGFAYKPKKKL